MSRVYIGRLPSRCSERDVERFFRDYGKIREIVLKNGYGFVEFDHYKDAEDAVYDLNGRELRGERVIIEHAKLPPGRDSRGFGSSRGGGDYGYRGGRRESSRYGPPTRTEYRAIVENLSSRISWQDLKDTMRKAGEVCYADAHRSNRNEGIVEFRSKEDLKAAIERFDGYELNGRKLKVFEDRGSKRRSSSRSRSRSRSSRSSRGRRSRSRSPRRRSARTGTKSASRSVSRNGARSASRSKSRSRSPVIKKSRSGTPARSRSRSPASNRSRSASRSPAVRRTKQNSSRSPSRSRSRSASPGSDRD